MPNIFSISEDIHHSESIQGNAYTTNTGVVNISESVTAVLYFLNNESEAFHITDLTYKLGNSISGSGDIKVKIYKNPTTGSIVSSGLVCEIAASNKNFGSSNVLSGSFLKGSAGNTILSGSLFMEEIIDTVPGKYKLNSGLIILETGNSIGVELTPSAGNTSLDIEVEINGFRDTQDYT